MATKEYFEALELLNSKDKDNFIHAYDLLDDEQQNFVTEAMRGKDRSGHNTDRFHLAYFKYDGEYYYLDGEKYKIYDKYPDLMFSTEGNGLLFGDLKKDKRNNVYRAYISKRKARRSGTRMKFSYNQHDYDLARAVYNTFHEKKGRVIKFKDGDFTNCRLENLVKEK